MSHLIEKPTIPDGNPIAMSLGEKLGVDMKSTKDLMNWVIFGDPKERGYFHETNHGGF